MRATPVPPTRAAWPGYAGALLAVACATLLGLALTPRFDIVNVAMLYLLAVVSVALRCSRGAAALTAAVSVAIFDLVFVPPRGTFAVHDLQYLLTFAILLAVALIVSELTRRTRHALEARARLSLEAEAERVRSTLLASISHDLRTPLSALTGQAETLQRQLAREASPHAAQAATLQTQSQRISRLVTNLLEMARLQAGGVTLRRDWLPPQELFGSAIAALGGATASHRLQVDAPLDCPMLYADPILLERLLVNLLENALKYSPAGSTITLAASASAQRILLSVADQGRGLPPGDPDALFTAFTRGERESAISGFGLGLAIGRTIADVHGGRISAANLPAGGACFTLSLPLAPQPALDFDPENLQ